VAYRFKIRKNSGILLFKKFVKIRKNSFLYIIIEQVSSLYFVFELWNTHFMH